MAGEPEQIEIEIDVSDPKPKDDEIKVVAAEDTPSPRKKEIPPEEGLDALKGKLERERAARIEAEQRADNASRREVEARTEVQDSNLHLINNAIETVKQNNEILKGNYSAAMASGDFDAAADIQMKMSGNSAKLQQLEQGKTALEAQPKPKQAESVVETDPVEHVAKQLSPRSASWLRSHPEFARDAGKFNQMTGAHYMAIGKGMKPDSDEYFGFIEGQLGISENEDPTPNADPTADTAKVTGGRGAAPPAAPVSRGGNGTGSRPNVVRLTAAEREMASMMKMTDQEYAKNKLALQKEGKIQ